MVAIVTSLPPCLPASLPAVSDSARVVSSRSFLLHIGGRSPGVQECRKPPTLRAPSRPLLTMAPSTLINIPMARYSSLRCYWPQQVMVTDLMGCENGRNPGASLRGLSVVAQLAQHSAPSKRPDSFGFAPFSSSRGRIGHSSGYAYLQYRAPVPKD
jgi:hypothetical protein